jgi:5-methylcytosine-specific restriction endonuclease McrA
MSASCLVLNSTYEPLNIATIARAVRLVLAGKAEVVQDRGRVSSPTVSFPLPSIIRMLYYIKHRRKRVPLTKKNVLLRDNYKCGYCDDAIEPREATVDHIVPRSAGGTSSWENLIASCSPCNGRKRDRTPAQAKMPLLRKPPREPKFIPFVLVRRHTEDHEWAKYLNLWNISIEERVV